MEYLPPFSIPNMLYIQHVKLIFVSEANEHAHEITIIYAPYAK